MSRPIVIGMACAPCLISIRTIATFPILVIDDQTERAAREEMLEQSTARVIQEFKITMAATRAEFLPMPSNREQRQAQQPFYRNLKKYRKP